MAISGGDLPKRISEAGRIRTSTTLNFEICGPFPLRIAHLPWMAKNEGDLAFTEEELAWHEEYLSASFLVLQGDTLLFERYWQGHDHTTVTNSFSACKSIVALAIGLAVSDGKVRVQDELAAYLPRFAGDGGKGLTVQEALQMRSHIPFGEDYANPFGFMAKAYYREGIQELLEPYRVPELPGAEVEIRGREYDAAGRIDGRVE